MKTKDERELEQHIHSFMERKLEKFPELRGIKPKQQPSNLLTRVQDFVAIWPHASHPRHSH